MYSACCMPTKLICWICTMHLTIHLIKMAQKPIDLAETKEKKEYNKGENS